MNLNTTIKTSLLMLGVTLASSLLMPAYAADGETSSKLFSKNTDINHKNFYVGGALASTMLEPKVLVTGGSVTENTSAGFKVYAGYNWNHFLAAELFYADLGKASVDLVNDESDVAYQAYGVGLNYTYHINYRIKLMGKLGLSALENQVDDSVTYVKANEVTFHKAVGLEYQINKEISLRADFDHYDEDYQMFSAGINYSF